MNTFTKNLNAVGNVERVRTENGAATFNSSGSALTDLFFAIGASRGKDISDKFNRALIENQDVAIRTLLWARDVRGGSGERQTARKLFQYLETVNSDLVIQLLPKMVELGRFDDLFIFKTAPVKLAAFGFYREALKAGNGLAFKWAPREKSAKRDIAREFMRFLDMSPTRYRKYLASNTKVIEQNMCAKDWTAINYSHVPSVAAARYRKAFYKNDSERYQAYVQALTKPETAVEKVKVNASAIFPHDIIKNSPSWSSYMYGSSSVDKTELDFMDAQWKALPSIELEGVMPIVDVSGSMTWFKVGGSTIPLHVAVGLGIYVSERQRGAFKNTMITFDTHPKMFTTDGNIHQKIRHVISQGIGGSTNLEGAFSKILDHAIKHRVPQSDMPKTLLIISDMEFNMGTTNRNATMYETLRKKYNDAGYNIPQVVFWNMAARNDNNPVKFEQDGTALISGYSQNVIRSLMDGEVPNPLSMLLKTVMKERYDY